MVSMATRVRFIGGELDGQLLDVQALSLRYEYKSRRRIAERDSDVLATGARTPRPTEYTLVRNSSGTPFYVENELLKLARAQGINPLPLE
jgi:hypothetical protein